MNRRSFIASLPVIANTPALLAKIHAPSQPIDDPDLLVTMQYVEAFLAFGVTCSFCGKPTNTSEAYFEECDMHACPNCYDRFQEEDRQTRCT